MAHSPSLEAQDPREEKEFVCAGSSCTCLLAIMHKFCLRLFCEGISVWKGGGSALPRANGVGSEGVLMIPRWHALCRSLASLGASVVSVTTTVTPADLLGP